MSPENIDRLLARYNDLDNGTAEKERHIERIARLCQVDSLFTTPQREFYYFDINEVMGTETDDDISEAA